MISLSTIHCLDFLTGDLFDSHRPLQMQFSEKLALSDLHASGVNVVLLKTYLGWNEFPISVWGELREPNTILGPPQ